jgi:hypothetical protein
MPQGPGTYGSQRGRPPKKESGFKLRSGNITPFKQMGSSPLKAGTSYSEGAQNLLKAVPDKEVYDKLSDVDKAEFDKAAKKHGLPTKSIFKK